MQTDISAAQVGAVVLAGGRGVRMGGVDKGLQPFRGQPMVWHALQRLQQQTLGSPALTGINANRNQEQYATLCAHVWTDDIDGFAGPLAGFLTALTHCQAHDSAVEYLLTVPCDSPLFPLDLLQRMAQALVQSNAPIAVASAPELDDLGSIRVRTQPVFCLMRTSLLPNLRTYVTDGGRKIDSWTQRQGQVTVAFDQPHDDARAFFNANTLEQLQQLEQQ
jgi:molybdopterin-guanine dinucleotide biosynthesis protein A